jgi:signal peptidase II
MFFALPKRFVSLRYSIILFGILILIIDQLSKYLVYRYIPSMEQSAYVYPYGGIGIFKNLMGIEFSINYLTNKGAAWGIFDHYQIPLVFLRIGLIGMLFIYLFFYNVHRSWQIPLVLIIAGALGNVMDFFVYGHVVDMIHIGLGNYDFPVFNIADSAISIGIVLLITLSYLQFP